MARVFNTVLVARYPGFIVMLIEMATPRRRRRRKRKKYCTCAEYYMLSNLVNP
jgi:hypothetical protein